jgi:hypothetical protein
VSLVESIYFSVGRVVSRDKQLGTIDSLESLYKPIVVFIPIGVTFTSLLVLKSAGTEALKLLI